MSRLLSRALGAATVVIVVACGESMTGPSALDLASAFTSSAAGFDAVTSSFASNGTEGGFMPHRGGPGGPGFGGGPGGGPGFGGGPGGGLMGGGLFGDFAGDRAPGRGPGHGPFGDIANDSTCAFSSASGSVSCAPFTNRGLTVVRIFTYKTAAGTAQAKPDSTTNSIRTQVTVSGTTTRRDSATTVVSHSSDRLVTGVASTSTQRTVNGTAQGTENTTGTSAQGAFTAVRSMGDTTVGLIVPVVDGRPTYPTAGKVTRVMKATVTITGQAAKTSERREVITYNGSATATLVITQDGVTKNCTIALPRGRPTCQ